MEDTGYRHLLRSVVASSTAPYGYTLTLWATGSVTSHAEGGIPSTLEVLLLLGGAVLGFGVVGMLAFGGINGALSPEPAGPVRVWGGMHLPSVGGSVLLVALLARVFGGHWVWAIVGLAATASYLLLIGGQFWLATRSAESGGQGQQEQQAPDRDTGA